MPTVKTKTSPSGLTPEEQKELERRGFLVKVALNYSQLTSIFINSVGIAVFMFTFAKLATHASISLMLLGCFLASIIPFLVYGKIIYYYIVLGKLFYTNKVVLGYNNVYDNVQQVPSFNVIERYRSTFGPDLGPFFELLTGVLMIFIGGIFLYLDLQEGKFLQRSGPIYYYSISIFYLLLPIIIYLLHQLVEHFHPLYAFGNLGSRIQSLTPRISETSEKIEKEFSTDMNFRTLSRSFDTLSKDFSEISSYVLKLEQIEQKANKGNLFDSEKYIGSLREDIVKPLTTLRSFLKKKKTELEASEQEMKKVRVRVGGSGHTGGNGETENLELQSKRSEPLRAELTENISKLDVMIEKFAKI